MCQLSSLDLGAMDQEIIKNYFFLSTASVSGGIVCFTMNAAQFDSAHNSFRLKCEDFISKRKWKLISQGITSQPQDSEKDNNNHQCAERNSSDSYVLVFVVIDNY